MVSSCNQGLLEIGPEEANHFDVLETLMLVQCNPLHIPLLNMLRHIFTIEVEIVTIAMLEQILRSVPLVVCKLPRVTGGEYRNHSVPVLRLREHSGVVNDEESQRPADIVKLLFDGD